jgi:hypothetical protein
MATLYVVEWFEGDGRAATIEMTPDVDDAVLALTAFAAGLAGSASRAGYLPDGRLVAAVTRVSGTRYRVRPDGGGSVEIRIRAVEDDAGSRSAEPCATCQDDWEWPFGSCSHDNVDCDCAADCACCRPAGWVAS